MQEETTRSGMLCQPQTRYEAVALRQSNGLCAARLVRASTGTYARAHLSEQGTERGGEWLRQGLDPNNYNFHTNKNNWGAAFARPIFLPFFRRAHAVPRTARGFVQELT